MPLKVCRLTAREAELYRRERVLPDCRNCNAASNNCGPHKHIGIDEARELVGPDDGTGRARWVDDRWRMMCDIPEREWKTVVEQTDQWYVPGIPRGCAGMSSKQLV